MILSKHRTALKNALIEGGAVLRSGFGQKFSIERKESLASVVTEIDLQAERAILEALNRHTPEISVLSEESGFDDRNSKYCWVVDPLDGTSNFVAGLPWFGVIIALIGENEPLLAGMFLPQGDLLYLAEKGKGATLNGDALSIAGGRKLEDCLAAYSFDYSAEEGKTASEMQVLERLSAGVRNVRSTNSLIDFCYTAEGRFGLAINQSTRIWDIAAPHLLIEEAGGSVSDIDGNKISYRIDAGATNTNYTIVAAAPGLLGQILEQIKE